MQKESKALGQIQPNLMIGYRIYKLKENETDGPLGKSFFMSHLSCAASNLMNIRQIVGRHKLAQGQYLIVPSTDQPGIYAEFLLRIYSEKQEIVRYFKIRKTFRESMASLWGGKREKCSPPLPHRERN